MATCSKRSFKAGALQDVFGTPKLKVEVMQPDSDPVAPSSCLLHAMAATATAAPSLVVVVALRARFKSRDRKEIGGVDATVMAAFAVSLPRSHSTWEHGQNFESLLKR